MNDAQDVRYCYFHHKVDRIQTTKHEYRISNRNKKLLSSRQVHVIYVCFSLLIKSFSIVYFVIFIVATICGQ